MIKYFTTQEIAERLGISKQTLVRYEKKGIFTPARRSQINNWRLYTEDDLKAMMEIIKGNVK